MKMKRAISLVVGMILATSSALLGQANLTGKWQTENIPAALEAEKNSRPAEPGTRGRGSGGQTIIMDLKADASGNVTGTVTEIGNPPVLTIENGKVDGTTVTWTTQPRGVLWKLELTNEDTLTLTGRVFRVGGVRGPGGGSAGGGTPSAG